MEPGRNYKKILLTDYRDFCKFLTKLTEDERLEVNEIATDILPMFVEDFQHTSHGLLDSVKEIVKVFGWKMSQAALALASEEVKIKILAAVIGILPVKVLPLVPG